MIQNTRAVSTTREAVIGGRYYKLTAGEEDIYYEGEWRTIHFDQEGNFFFHYKGEAIYFRAIIKEKFFR